MLGGNDEGGMTETIKMPSWPEFAKSIVEMYVDSLHRANEAAAIGETENAREFEQLAVRCKRMMDENKITMRRA